MVKETGEILLDQGKPVEAELEFTPGASEGTVEMTFTFDASDLAGKNLVVFETLSREGREIASHKDFDAGSRPFPCGSADFCPGSGHRQPCGNGLQPGDHCGYPGVSGG